MQANPHAGMCRFYSFKFMPSMELRIERIASIMHRIRPVAGGGLMKRAFMSKQEEKVNILIRFGIFYLCNGRPVNGHSHARRGGHKIKT